MKWSKAWQYGWVSILAALGVYELWSWTDHDTTTPTLTKFVLNYIPWYAALPFFAWLIVHFALRYWRKRKAQK